MKRYNNILAAILLVTLSSCYKEIPFRGMESEHQLFIQSLPGAQDTTVFWLRSTIPVNQDLLKKDVVNPKISLKINGIDTELRPNAGQSSTFPDDAYFATAPVASGDRLELYAEADGFKPISAQTMVPGDLGEISLSSAIVPSPNPDYYVAVLDDRASQSIAAKCAQFKVTFQDQPDVKDFYMVEVSQYIYRHDGTLLPYSQSVAYIVPKLETDIFEQAQTDVLVANHYSPWQTIEYDRGGDSKLVMFFDDKKFDGLKYTKEVLVNCLSTGENTPRYRFRLYRVAEELYKYAKAWDTARKADYAELPSTIPLMAYNNITGGSGIFAGVQVYDSGIIALPMSEDTTF